RPQGLPTGAPVAAGRRVRGDLRPGRPGRRRDDGDRAAGPDPARRDDAAHGWDPRLPADPRALGRADHHADGSWRPAGAGPAALPARSDRRRLRVQRSEGAAVTPATPLAALAGGREPDLQAGAATGAFAVSGDGATVGVDDRAGVREAEAEAPHGVGAV